MSDADAWYSFAGLDKGPAVESPEGSRSGVQPEEHARPEHAAIGTRRYETFQVRERASLFRQPFQQLDVLDWVSPLGKFSPDKPSESSPAKSREPTGDPDLGARLKKRREELGLTQSDMGISKALMSQYESGWTMPKPDTLSEFADKLHISIDELMGRKAGEPTGGDGRYVLVPRYEAQAGLGRGRFNDDHVEISGSYPMPAELIARNRWRIEALKVVDGNGQSMAPNINHGDPVVINLDLTKIESGKVYAIETPDDGLRLKRLVRQMDGRILVRCDNPDKLNYPDEYLTPDSGARIVGKVVDRRGEP